MKRESLKVYPELFAQINLINTTFQNALCELLNLIKVPAPLFVERGTGLQDNLNGISEQASVVFFVDDKLLPHLEVVQSLAKWKRSFIGKYSVPEYSGIVTEMHAIRPEDEIDVLHSLYVDQWDWELRISAGDRTLELLKQTVGKIYCAMKITEQELCRHNGQKKTLSEDITFVHSQELLNMYPTLSARERENAITRKHGSVFVIGIGEYLSNGERHGHRAADTDDWSSQNRDGYYGLNGDILIWSEVLQSSVELSSMGIRVNREVLQTQMCKHQEEDRLNRKWYKDVINGYIPDTVGGGIGKSRLLMLLLQKAHIGEVQFSTWKIEYKENVLSI